MKNRVRPSRATVPRNIFSDGVSLFLFATELEEGTVNKTPISDMILEHVI